MRAGAIASDTREIEFRLDADFHVLGVPHADGRPYGRARAAWFARFLFLDLDFVRDHRSGLKWKPGLRVVRPETAAAGAILLKTPGNFQAPLGLFRFAEDDGSGGYRFEDFGILGRGNFTERASSGVVEQKGATLRADAYHW